MIYSFITIVILSFIAMFLIIGTSNDIESAKANAERAKVWVALAFLCILCVHWHIGIG